jgi:hypothetical protein
MRHWYRLLRTPLVLIAGALLALVVFRLLSRVGY